MKTFEFEQLTNALLHLEVRLRASKSVKEYIDITDARLTLRRARISLHPESAMFERIAFQKEEAKLAKMLRDLSFIYGGE